MKKKISFIIVICMVICVTALLGYSYGKRDDSSNLPVYESMAVYPEFSMPELTEKASIIVNATVVNVGDTYIEEIPVSITENSNEASEVLYNPITPITLEVETYLKGDKITNTLTYYEEGGITPTYIQLPNGYAMEEGMEVILFLNEEGCSWGAQSIFPIVDNEVILNEMALDYLDDSEVTLINTSQIEENVRSQINESTVSVISKEDFLSVIAEMVNN